MQEEQNKRLAEIEDTLKDIHRILKPTGWEMFVQGMLRAVGYILGLMLAIIIIGWFLNMIGVIPFMSDIAQSMKEVLNIAKTR